MAADPFDRFDAGLTAMFDYIGNPTHWNIPADMGDYLEVEVFDHLGIPWRLYRVYPDGNWEIWRGWARYFADSPEWNDPAAVAAYTARG